MATTGLTHNERTVNDSQHSTQRVHERNCGVLGWGVCGVMHGGQRTLFGQRGIIAEISDRCNQAAGGEVNDPQRGLCTTVTLPKGGGGESTTRLPGSSGPMDEPSRRIGQEYSSCLHGVGGNPLGPGGEDAAPRALLCWDGGRVDRAVSVSVP